MYKEFSSLINNEKRELKRLIIEDNVQEFEKILNSNKDLHNKLVQNNFNTIRIPQEDYSEQPLLLLVVQEKSQKILEYLLSQDFVDKSICNEEGKNIYHVVCKIRGAEELFSIIERKVPHNLILNRSLYGNIVFHDTCEFNNIVIVKRVYEIMESLQVDLTHIKNNTMKYAVFNDDTEVIKYILSIDGIQLNDEDLFSAIKISKIDIVVYLLNFYLCQSIPSHLHNQFHIFQFSNHHPSNIDNPNKINNINNKIIIMKIIMIMNII